MLFDSLSQIWHKLRIATSVESALKQRVSPRLVSHLASQFSEGKLIEAVAQSTGQDMENLLSQVGRTLELQVTIAPQCPNSRLITKTGYSEDTLRQLGILPLAQGNGYKLALSDPRVIDRQEYTKRSIPIYLSTQSSIDQAWRTYDSLKASSELRVSETALKTVISEITLHAHNQGARELFIGVPDQSHYEFITNDKKYRGSIHQSIYYTLHELLKPQQPYEWTTHDSPLKGIRIGFANRVFHTRWRTEVTFTDKTSRALEVLTTLDDNLSDIESDIENDIENAQQHIQSSSENISVDSVLVHGQGDIDVLIIDDDTDFSTIATKMFERHNYSVLCCRNALSALELLNAEAIRPRVIVCDVHMPTLDGPSFLSKLRNSCIEIPVIMLTSDEDELLEVELAELGAAAFVLKQENPKILLAWIKNCLAKSKTVHSKDLPQSDEDKAFIEDKSPL